MKKSSEIILDLSTIQVYSIKYTKLESEENNDG